MGLGCLLLALTATSPVAWIEAEACDIQCAVPPKPGDSLFASGGHFSPPFWAQSPTDSIAWSLRLEEGLDEPWLAIRYAFDRARFDRNPASSRQLMVKVGRTSMLVPVPDTSDWSQYEVAWVKLPNLSRGVVTLTISAGQPEMNTDVDCLGLFRRKPLDPAPPFVPTLVAKSKDGRLVLRRSANAKCPDPAEVFRQFGRIDQTMREFGGCDPSGPVGVNVLEADRWPNPGWSAFSNNFGCFFREVAMPTDSGNWGHEMTHLMFRGRCPKWLEEPLVHFLTLYVWNPRLFYGAADRDKASEDIRRVGKEFWQDTQRRYDDLLPVLMAIADRYGADCFGRLLKRCFGLTSSSDQALNPGPVSTEQVLAEFSAAAGSDIRPALSRWNGFELARL